MYLDEEVEVACMPKGQPKYTVIRTRGAMHRLICEDGPLYVYISPSNELVMIRESELCTTCGGTGLCPVCKGEGRLTCHSCNGTGHRRVLGLLQITCSTCGGTGLVVCTNCNSRGVCPHCMGRRHKTPKTPVRSNQRSG